MQKLNFKMNKNRWIILIFTLAILIGGGIFLFMVNSSRVLTKSEYVKEAVFQKEDFEDLLDNYLDQVVSYNGTREATEKLENTATKLTEFVTKLRNELGPRVPKEASGHYDSMIKAYEMYVESVDMYKKAVPKPGGEERNTLLKEAGEKLKEAKEAMKNLK